MTAFKKKAGGTLPARTDALKSIPVKNLRVEEGRLESGEVIIRYPVSMRPWVAGVIKRLRGSADAVRSKKLQLDVLGTEVWNLIDGHRSVRRIVEIFAESHRLQRREAEAAVTQFMRQLGQRGLIGLR
jgi:hypothetical protein